MLIAHSNSKTMDEFECRDTAEDFQKRHERRTEALQLYYDQLLTLICTYPSQRSKKVKSARSSLAVFRLNPLFDNDDDEYAFVHKFGRGKWQDLCILFDENKESMKLLVEFAEKFGAFDY